MWLGTVAGGLHMWMNDLGLGQARRLDAAPRQAGQRTPEARGADAADRLSEARRRAHLRQAVLGVPVEHQPRGRPAGAPAVARSGDSGRREPRASTTGPSSAIARRGSTSSSTTTRRAAGACRSTRRTACTARPATSRIRCRTSTGWCPKAAADRTIPACDRLQRGWRRRLRLRLRWASRQRAGVGLATASATSDRCITVTPFERSVIRKPNARARPIIFAFADSTLADIDR